MSRAGFNAIVAAIVMMGLVGCAQNVEPKGTITQQTEGPQQPQKITNNTWNVAGDYITGDGSATLRPAPGESVADAGGESANSGAVRSARGIANARAGTAGGVPRAGGNVMIVSNWSDAKGRAEPGSGNITPTTGGQDFETTPTQRVEPDINLPVAISAGMNPTASSQGTQAARGGTVSESPSTSDQSGARSVTQIKTPANLLNQAMDYLKGLQAQGVTQVPLSGASTAAGEKQLSVQELLSALQTLKQEQEAAAKPAATQPASQPAGAAAAEK